MLTITDYALRGDQQLDTPVLLLYPALIQKNLDAMRALVGDMSRLRPHVKTDKIGEVIGLMIQAGISRFKCATIAEAEMLAAAGAKDILLAYQPSPVKAKRLRALTTAYPAVRFSCLVDNTAVAEMLAEIFETLEVFLDVNVGMNRTGIGLAGLASLFNQVRAIKQLSVVGIHVYDGHVDNPDQREREVIATRIFREVGAVKKQLEAEAGGRLDWVIAGSPTFAFYHRLAVEAGIPVQLSPGTFTFWDAGYSELLPELPFVPAAVLAGTVVSIVSATLVCVDLGYKAVAAESPIHQRLTFPWLEGVKPVAQSEEHLVLEVPDAGRYHPGDVIYAIPWHICPTIALYDTVPLVQGGVITGEWLVTARRRKINY